jgi:hypothetical protein
MADWNYDLGLSSRQVMARTSSKAIIASPAAVRLIAPEVAMPPLLNLVTAPARSRCILMLFSVAAH